MEYVSVAPEIYGYDPSLDPSSARADLPVMARELAAHLPGLGWNVTLVAAIGGSASLAPGLAKHVTPLHAHTADHDLEIDVFEGSLGASHARMILLGMDPRPVPILDRDLVLTPEDAQKVLRWTADFGAAVAALFERLGLQPDVLHLHGEAVALAPLLPPSGAVALSIYDPQRDAAFPLEDWCRATGVPVDSQTEGATASQAAVAAADLVLLPSPGAKLQLRLTRRRLVLKEALAQHPRVYGVLGGVERGVWDPTSDPELPARFGPEDPTGKTVCRRALQDRTGMAPRRDVILAAATLGQTPEDGAEQLVEAAQEILDLDIQLVIYCPRNTEPPARLERLAETFPGRFALVSASQIRLADVLAGADVVIQSPSWSPWGRFVQLGMAFGAVPVVRATGGLDDLVVDWDAHTKTGGGFKFRRESTEELLAALLRARETFHEDPEGWRAMVYRNMRWTRSWEQTASQVHELFLDSLDAARPEVAERASS